MGLVDDAPDRERLARAGTLYQVRRDTYEDVLRRLLAHDSDSIRSLVVYHVGELGLSALQPEIESLEASETGALSQPSTGNSRTCAPAPRVPESRLR